MALRTRDITISSLGLHPGKSMRFDANVPSLDFNEDGIFGDREIMLVEGDQSKSEPGTFLSQRKDPSLARIIPTITFGPKPKIKLRIDGIRDSEITIDRANDARANHLPISVHGWSGIGVDQGDSVAKWASEYVGRNVRLVATSNSNPRFVEGINAMGRVGFSDGYPLLVISIGSINELNRWLTSKGFEPINANRFRPNIVLDIDEPFIEDKIASLTFYDEANGEKLLLARAKACERCTIPGKDQKTGEPTHNILKALAGLGRNGIHSNTQRYGSSRSMFFGQNFTIAGLNSPFSLTTDAVGQANFSTHANWAPSR